MAPLAPVAAITSFIDLLSFRAKPEGKSRNLSFLYLSCRTSAPKSCQVGFIWLISAIFLARDHFFNCDSRDCVANITVNAHNSLAFCIDNERENLHRFPL